jgi:two-component system, cell cycle sensor histidine kinase and response regulator CckA
VDRIGAKRLAGHESTKLKTATHTGPAIAICRDVAAAVSGPITGKQIGEFTLDSLPFGAAWLDASGAVVAGNARWQTEGCNERYCSAAVQRGVKTVLSGQSEQFAEYCHAGPIQYRITVTRQGDGALVIEQPLEPGLLAQSGKMEAIGRLAGGVAHDFANLLTLIGGYSDMLLTRIGEKDPLRAELEEIRKAAVSGSRLTAQLLNFTRGQSVEPRILDLNELVLDLRRMLEPIIGEDVELLTELDPALRKVLVDRGQMEQVIMNLVLNARDAMPQGGKIRIRTSHCEIQDETARVRGMEPGTAATLSISDTGHGIAPGDLERLWQPFFTTKEEGKGTGLGLTIVRKIVHESRGDISVRSVLGEGTTFTVSLPCTQSVREHGETPLGPAAAGNETVLLVEDEDGVRRLLTQVLQRRGYRVLEASNGEEALQLFEQQGADIHLVLTDMVMPRMGGRDLALRLNQIRPELKVIFMSGYTDDVLVRTGALLPGMPFLRKPLRTEVLAAKVRETLDSPARPFNPH